MRRRAVPLVPVGVFDFVEPIRSGAKRRRFFVTDGRCLSLNFQFRRSACRSGRAVREPPLLNPLPSSDRTEDNHRARL
jgi:hypothetical protein